MAPVWVGTFLLLSTARAAPTPRLLQADDCCFSYQHTVPPPPHPHSRSHSSLDVFVSHSLGFPHTPERINTILAYTHPPSDTCPRHLHTHPTPTAGTEAGDGDGDGVDGAQAQAESGPATKRSLESVKAGERLMDALELAELELKLVRADERAAAKAKRKGEPAPPARRPNPVLLNLSPLRYVLRTLQVCNF